MTTERGNFFKFKYASASEELKKSRYAGLKLLGGGAALIGTGVLAFTAFPATSLALILGGGVAAAYAVESFLRKRK